MSIVDISSSGAANDTTLDNVVQPFQLESSSLRGRLVRLGKTLDDIIRAHDYPDEVSYKLAESLTLALLLTSMLKHEGIFTLQTSSDGPISMIVVDVTTSGNVRGYASFDQQALEKTSGSHVSDVLGKGYLAFTVDQAGDAERYQGIVELQGETMADCARNYFDQSEQIGTAIQLAVAKHGGTWRAGGLMLQHMPEHGEYAKNSKELHKIKKAHLEDAGESDDDPIRENWQRASILLNSCTPEELTSSGLQPSSLLTRLFHEEGVRVYTPISVVKKCRCSKERIYSILSQLPAEELQESATDGLITSTCEFCSQEYKVEISNLTT